MIKLFLVFIFLCASPLFAAVGFNNQTGTDALLACGSSTGIMTGSAAETISFWFYDTSLTSNGSTPRVLGRFSTGGSSGVGSEVDVAQNNAVAFVISTGTTNMSVISGTNSIPFNTIFNVTITTDGSLTATNTHIYINGTEASYQTETSGSGSITGGGTFYIGNRGNAARPLRGTIYEVEDWSQILTSGEITSVYHAGKQGYNMRSIEPQALQSWWRLNGCADGQVCSNTFTDEMGNNNCTPSNSPVGVSPTYNFLPDIVMKDAVLT